MPFIEMFDVPEREPVPGYRVKFVHSGTMTLAYWDVEAGAALPEHSHPHEQVSTVVEGTFEMTLDGRTRQLDPGTVAVIPSDVSHRGVALTHCRIIDAFHPVREDYR
jgi:quercetin dioxygenase-like cupin family protein